jgi:multiple sugar transport system ATP-binding protein
MDLEETWRSATVSSLCRRPVRVGQRPADDRQAFLMDERLSNLDAKLRVQMRAEIEALQHQLACG